MIKTQHKRTIVASIFQNGISQNTKCAARDGFCRDTHIFLQLNRFDWLHPNPISLKLPPQHQLNLSQYSSLVKTGSAEILSKVALCGWQQSSRFNLQSFSTLYHVLIKTQMVHLLSGTSNQKCYHIFPLYMHSKFDKLCSDLSIAYKLCSCLVAIQCTVDTTS